MRELPFKLTNSQENVLSEINLDLKYPKRMFRILQGDVGSGKTIVSFLTVANVLGGYQCALMSPTEILSLQHFHLAKVFKDINIRIEFLTGKTTYSKRKEILKI